MDHSDVLMTTSQGRNNLNQQEMKMSCLDSPPKKDRYFLFHFHKVMVTVSSLIEEWMSLKKKRQQR